MFKEFITYTYDEAMKFINTQAKFNQQHVRFESLSYMFVKHKFGKENKVMRMLNKGVLMMATMVNEMVEIK